jgi:hypothetical protein
VRLETRQDRRRADISIVADVRFNSEPWRKARLDDLSTSGFRIGWGNLPSKAQTISIRIADLEAMRAKIVWRDETKMGCEFVRPLSVYVFEHILRQAR